MQSSIGKDTPKYARFALAGLLLVLVLHLCLNGSQDLCDLVLALLRDQIGLLSAWVDKDTRTKLQQTIPRSVKTVITMFDLDPPVHRYLTCPKCFALVSAPSGSQEGFLLDEIICQHQETPASVPCREKLTRRNVSLGKVTHRPIKEYYHQDMLHWMGRFISRPDIEQRLRSRKQEFQDRARRRQAGDGAAGPRHVGDILESPAIESFVWPDGKAWYDCADDEYRLFFTISGDGFNAFSNKEAKQTASSTGIYLFCNNLPLDERQKPENVYLVGVIPGPDKPSTSQINHFTSLVVNDLRKFWETGVQYTQTHCCPKGVLIRCAGAPVVCDALGARQMCGYASVTSQFFCTYCWLPLSHLENFTKSSWPMRTLEEHRFWAEEWRDARDEASRLRIFEAHGIRWTPFLTLPYFDPIKFTVVDTMHNFFLGLLQRHCRAIWGMDISLEDGDGTEKPRKTAPSPPSEERMKEARRALEFNDQAKLGSIRKHVLWFLCLELDLRRGGKKRDLIRELLLWVSTQAVGALSNGRLMRA